MTKLQNVIEYIKDKGFHVSQSGLDVRFLTGRDITHYQKRSPGTGFFSPEIITLASSEISGRECVETFFSLNVTEGFRREVYQILNTPSAPASAPEFR